MQELYTRWTLLVGMASILTMLLVNYYQLYNLVTIETSYRKPNHVVLKRDLHNKSNAGNDVIMSANNDVIATGNGVQNSSHAGNITETDEESEEVPTEIKPALVSKRRKKYTFATLLCDDKLIQATSVLVYSLINYAHTRHPVTIMALPNVSMAAKWQLQKLGAQVMDFDMLEYPFKITPARLEQNKPCRYSKLQLWSMTQFDKVVYMDSDMMAVQNIDNLFEEYDEFSAVVDAYPGIFNTGIFLLEPNLTTYNNLISTYKEVESYNVGDQGYLNWYFGRKWRSNTSYQTTH